MTSKPDNGNRQSGGRPSTSAKRKPEQPWWLLYLTMLVGGMLLLSYVFGWFQMDRWTARLGLALVYSAFILLMGRGRTMGFICVAVIWIVAIATFFV